MSLYSTLGINKDASPLDIKRAFRTLSMEYHPDKSSGDADKYKEISNAYDILSDVKKRQQYDHEEQFGKGHMFGGGGGGGFNHGDIFNMMFGGGGGGGFEQMFGGGGPNVRIFQNGRPVFSKPPPIQHIVVVSLEESFTGTNKKILIHRKIMQGNTNRDEEEAFYIPIPKGADNDEVIVLQQRGHIHQNMKGDVQIKIVVKNTSVYTRRGMDLVYKKSISFKDSLCGFKFVIDHIDGKKYNINNNQGKIIYPGFTKTIPNLGMVRNNSNGKLIIEFNVNYPSELTEKQVETFRDIL